MQPYFFPYIGYFQLLYATDTFVILDDVNYINRGWVNRNYILSNGQPLLITVPLSGASQNKHICNVGVVTEDQWRKKMLRTIEHSYSKAPFFTDVYRIVSDTLTQDFNSISELNVAGIVAVLNYLGGDSPQMKKSCGYSNADLRGQQRIIDICKRESATSYLNLPGGIDLYDRKEFQGAGIQLKFIRPNNVTYSQGMSGGNFVPNLSIMDVLMFNSVERTWDILKHYESI